MNSPVSDICHDLKTERADVGQPLPQVMRILPIAFFVAVVGSALLSTVFLLRYRAAETAKSQWLTKEAQYSEQLKASEQKLADIKLETQKAQEAASWIEGTRSIQEVVLAVTRSMETDTTLGSLGVRRQEDDPAKLQFSVKIDGPRTEPAKQLELLLGRINDIGYSNYASNQSQGKENGGLSYEATLIRREDR